MNIKEIVHFVIDFLFPRHCILCDEVLPFGNGITNKYLCDTCINKIEFIKEPTCKKCGAMINDEYQMYCTRCENMDLEKSSYEYGFGLCRYNDDIKESLRKIKYSGRREYIEFYGKCISQKYFEKIKDINADCMIPVPIHKKRLLQRNYNQAEVLAQSISNNLRYLGYDLKVDTNVAFRTKNTKVLNKLDNFDRTNEIKNAFFINKNNYNSVIIIDDIYTTGSTIEELSKQLKESGIKNIYFITIAIVDNL